MFKFLLSENQRFFRKLEPQTPDFQPKINCKQAQKSI